MMNRGRKEQLTLTPYSCYMGDLQEQNSRNNTQTRNVSTYNLQVYNLVVCYVKVLVLLQISGSSFYSTEYSGILVSGLTFLHNGLCYQSILCCE